MPNIETIMKKLFLLLAAVYFAVAVVSCSQKDEPWSHSTLDVKDPEGTLKVNAKNLVIPEGSSCAKLIATYKNAIGLYEPTIITLEPSAPGVLDGDNMVFDLEPGSYTVKARKLSMPITVRRQGN